MTIDEAITRQADHENLVHELAELLRAVDDYGVRLVMGDAWALRVDRALEKVAT